MDKRELENFFVELDRSFFMNDLKEFAREDRALPIGYGQTISQPSLVMYMTELLDLHGDSTVLEIGTGSGYQTAFLAEFAKEVYTVERIEPLLEQAKQRLDELGYENVSFFCEDGSYGLEDFAPFDRIIVTAAANKIPGPYIEQLAEGGVMIIPVGDSYVQELLKVTKSGEGIVNVESIEAVRFVPLVGPYEI